MSTKKQILFIAASLLLAGCGRHYSGVYHGKESVIQNGAQPVMSDMTMTLNHTDGDNVSGTFQSSKGDSGTITGTSTKEGLSNVTMTLAPGSNYAGGGAYGYYPYLGAGTNCSMTYTGTLSSQNSKQLTGTLIGAGTCFLGGANSRTIDITK